MSAPDVAASREGAVETPTSWRDHELAGLGETMYRTNCLSVIKTQGGSEHTSNVKQSDATRRKT